MKSKLKNTWPGLGKGPGLKRIEIKVKQDRTRIFFILFLSLFLTLWFGSFLQVAAQSVLLSEQKTVGSADSSSDQALSLKECLEIALANNPLMLSSYDQYEAARARVNIARNLPQPGILLDYPLQPTLISPGRSEEKFFWLNQTVEFPGRRYLRTKFADWEAREIFQDHESLKVSLAYQVKEAFFGLLLVEEQLKFARENLQLNRDFVDLVEVKHSVGEVSQAEVLRARVELAKAGALVKQLETERKITAARLNVLMGRDRDGEIQIAGELKQPLLALSFEDARKTAMVNRPEIKKVEYSVNKTVVQKKQAYLSYLPDFNLGFARHQVENIKYWDFSLSLSVPLFFWQPKRGEIAEAEALIRSKQRELIYWQDMVSLEVEEAYQQVLCCQEQIRLYEKDILEQTEQVYQLFLFSFKEGQIGGLDLIEARRTWVDSRITYAEHLYQHAISLAALNRAMGIIQEGDQ
ncbi:MAG: TolC family protein [Candidatus Aminicenantes bacterium]|nr:TolC family protein [Candidatus Aminicenantes bacterium]